MKEMIYMDHAATTPVRREVVRAMLPYFHQYYGNPSSIYEKGAESRRAMDKAREQIADVIHGKPEEICFTSGGTEADQLAICGAAEAVFSKKNHIITTAIEHHAVLHTCEKMKEKGWNVTFLPVNREGQVSPADVRRAIRKETGLISVMAANNEVGTIQPLEEIGEIANRHGILFHTDAVQALGQIPVSVEKWKVDLLSGSAHKFYGPKGTGFLYVRSGVKIEPQILGGGQEEGLRSGTENVPGIVGAGQAIKAAESHREQDSLVIKGKRDYLIRRVIREVPRCRLTGSLRNRLPGNASFLFGGIDGNSLVYLLGEDGICVSSGSACSSGSGKPSHVLLAMNYSAEAAYGSLRITLGIENSQEEIDWVADRIREHVNRLRRSS
ncbi:MAG: cysteine desulfurase family protein [Clostridiales bacterium]|nr:cysteine desulfurase family protein [Clostridiales bacterium]